MYTLFPLFVAGIVLAVAGVALGGAPAGRDQGAAGSPSKGAERGPTDYSAIGIGAHKSNNVSIALRGIGRTVAGAVHSLTSATQFAGHL